MTTAARSSTTLCPSGTRAVTGVMDVDLVMVCTCGVDAMAMATVSVSFLIYQIFSSV